MQPILIRRLVLGILLGAAAAITASAHAAQLPQPDGTVLNVEGPVSRIITLSPHLTEIAFAAGAGDRLVATVEYSDYPEAAQQIPRIGDAFRIDLERVVALQPDLVIAWESGNPDAAMARLRALGIPLWSVEIREPGEIADTLDHFGTLAGQSTQAAVVSADIRRRLAALVERYEDAQPHSYFYQIGSRPLFTVNGKHLISKSLNMCGGSNIFDAQPGLAFQVSYESVIAADPDAIFAPTAGQGPDPLAQWSEWPRLKAVREQALFLLPADQMSRAAPRFLDSLELACKLLHQLRE